MTVFTELVGQERVVAALSSAVASAADVLRGEPGPAMTHAWLFTGPPGSGRSVAARAFAAGLQCERGGCGRCHACHTVLGGTHPDVEIVTPEGLSIKVDEAREIVRRSARAPSQGRWQITVVEDADRLTEDASNALLKALEEPPARGVFLLCAPTPEDLLATIRSRCRTLTLRIPPYDAVAEHIADRDGVDRELAAFAAHAAQGHVGRARRFVRDEAARRRRREVLRLPTSVGSVGACFVAAANLVDAAKEEAATLTEELDTTERAALEQTFGEGRGRARSRDAAAVKSLERQQKSRATRTQRDALDRALVDLAAFYRDVLVVQVCGGAPAVDLINADLAPAVTSVATGSTPESTLRRIEAILGCRSALEENVAPLLAVEAMTLALHEG